MECEHCGKHTDDGVYDPTQKKYLCLYCMYRTRTFRKQTESQKPDAALEPLTRVHRKTAEPETVTAHMKKKCCGSEGYPISVGLDLSVLDQTTKFFFTTEMIGLTEEGIVMKWHHCKPCSGYSLGAIHPHCLFSSYDVSNPRSIDLVFSVDTPDHGNVEFKGKVEYIFKDQDVEKIGISFTEIYSDAMGKLMNMKMQYTEAV